MHILPCAFLHVCVRVFLNLEKKESRKVLTSVVFEILCVCGNEEFSALHF